MQTLLENEVLAVAQITARGQATIPHEVRAVEGTLSEWSGAADEEAYREL